MLLDRFDVEGIDWQLARTYIVRYRDTGFNEANGNYYDFYELDSYLKFFEKIIDKQQTAPAGYKWKIGFYHGIENNHKLTSILAPVLVNKTPPAGMPEVLDFVDYPQFFQKDIRDDVTNNPIFTFDEGHLWP